SRRGDDLCLAALLDRARPARGRADETRGEQSRHRRGAAGTDLFQAYRRSHRCPHPPGAPRPRRSYRQRSNARAAPAMSNGGRRISPQEAFERLLPRYDGWVARDRLNAGVRNPNILRLFRDGVQLTPAEIADKDIYFRAEPLRDGRWCCTIVEGRPGPMRVPVVGVDDTGPVQMIEVVYPPDPVWALENIAALLLLPAPRRGTKSVLNWTGIVDARLLYLQYNGSSLLQNPEQLYVDVASHVAQETGQPVKYPRKLRQRILAFLKRTN